MTAGESKAILDALALQWEIDSPQHHALTFASKLIERTARDMVERMEQAERAERIRAAMERFAASDKSTSVPL